MTISLKEKDWFMAKDETTRIVRPREELEWDRDSRVIFHTPNLAEKIATTENGETSIFYMREGIDLRKSRGFGGETRIVERLGRNPKRQSGLSNSERAMFFAMGIADAYILWWLWNYGVAHHDELDNNELVLTDYELQEVVDQAYAAGFIEGLESGDPIDIVIDNEGNVEPDQGNGFEADTGGHDGGTDADSWDPGPDSNDYDSGDSGN